jgi:hypothetical protein
MTNPKKIVISLPLRTGRSVTSNEVRSLDSRRLFLKKHLSSSSKAFFEMSVWRSTFLSVHFGGLYKSIVDRLLLSKTHCYISSDSHSDQAEAFWVRRATDLIPKGHVFVVKGDSYGNPYSGLSFESVSSISQLDSVYSPDSDLTGADFRICILK